MAGPEVPYRANFERTVTRGTCTLHVSLHASLSRQQAAAIAARHGGVDVLARADGSMAPEPAPASVDGPGSLDRRD